jgi:phosphopantothenate--cysteine ligase
MSKINLSDKTIIITSGGTREYIDDVRVLTNISSGKLGAMIADECLTQRANVYYIHAKGAVMPKNDNDSFITLIEITTVADLIKAFEKIVEETSYPIDAVVMAIAASDFTFNRDIPIKLKSNDPKAFIEHMGKMIAPNPKVITKVKGWFPNTYLVGFKFEVGLEHDELIKVARESMIKSKADLVFANDKKEMERFKHHVGYLVTKDNTKMCEGKDHIASQLVNQLIAKLNVL